MVNFPTKDELRVLQSFDEPYCLTIYVPYLDANAATNPNRIELKNLLREAETALISAGAKPREVKKTLRPALALIEDHEFWPIHREGLALFMHSKKFHYYHVPNHVSPYMLTVERGFNVDPIIKAMQKNQEYFVLAVGHKNLRLFKGDRYQIKPLRLKNFPTDMKTALNIDEYPAWRETHKIAPSYIGKGSEAFHGQYNVSQTDKDMLLEFFRLVDRRLHNFLFRQQKPLIIAGVDFLLPIYRKANTYPGLIGGAISGNQEHTDLLTIRKKAWSIVKRSPA